MPLIKEKKIIREKETNGNDQKEDEEREKKKRIEKKVYLSILL